MKRKAASESGAAEDSPRAQLIKAFDSLEVPLMMAHAAKRPGIQKEHKMQLRSAEIEASEYPAVVTEGSQGFTIYAKLHLTKPLYRKLELLAQLNDESLLGCIVGMLEAEVEAVLLGNSEELASLIRKRILEEAYDVGSKMPSERQAIIEGYQELEKTSA